MSNFNAKLVESLDLLNHILAAVFFFLAIFRFVDMLPDNFLGGLFDALSIIGLGILTCGYIALMININNLLRDIRDGRRK